LVAQITSPPGLCYDIIELVFRGCRHA
jgi:hypothetical protein